MNNVNYKTNLKYSQWMLSLLLLFASQLAFAQRTDADLALKKAQEETNKKNYTKAMQYAEAGLRSAPNYLDLRLLLGRLYLQTGKTNAALGQFRRALVIDKDNKLALNYIINTYDKAKSYNNAITYATTYLKYYPDDKDILVKRSTMFFEAGRYPEGAAAYKGLMGKYSRDEQLKDAFVYQNLTAANKSQKAGKTDMAVELYKNVLEVEPKNTDALNALLNLNAGAGNKSKAIEYASSLEGTADAKTASLKKINLLRQSGRHSEAVAAAASLYKKYPNDKDVDYVYKDALFARAKSQLANRDTTAALNTYRNIVNVYPADTAARNRMVNLQIKRGNYDAALAGINSGMRYYPNSQSIFLKQLDANQMKGDKKSAYKISEKLAKKYPKSSTIKELNDELFVATRQNRAGLSYGITAFDPSQDAWHLVSANYLRTEKWGSIGGRVNYADRGADNGIQFEVEAYPLHGKSKTYSFVNLAYSPDVIFPEFRASYSFFLPFEKTWQAELGARYLKSYYNYYSFVGGLGKFFGKYFVNGQVFVTTNEGNTPTSFNLSGRYYLNNFNTDYVTAFMGYGFSPDDRGRNFAVADRLDLESFRVGAGYQKTVNRQHILGVFGSYNNQEFLPNQHRNEFDLTLSYQYRF